MSSRNSILQAIRRNAPKGEAELPQLPSYAPNPDHDCEAFTQVLASVHTRLMQQAEALAFLNNHLAKGAQVASTLPEFPGNVNLSTIKEPLELAGIDLAILRGQFGVVENGAIWVTEQEAVVRALPFITQHLMLVIDGPIVPTMHEAYQRISIDETGFGVFIAGPSKTADIEQSLVIGAHGPRSLTVVESRADGTAVQRDF
jgi:L-lactate dehydrogenase complex protein LldG